MLLGSIVTCLQLVVKNENESWCFAGDGGNDQMRLSAGSLIRAHHSSLDSSGNWGQQYGSMPMAQDTAAMLHNNGSNLDSELQVCISHTMHLGPDTKYYISVVAEQ